MSLLVVSSLSLSISCAGGSPAAPASAAAVPVGAAAAPAGAVLPAIFDAEAIDAYVAAQVKTRELVGASLVLLRDGGIVLSRSYGLASLATREPVTPATPFAIGSITKQFICAAALLLEEDGKLSLDDKVAAHYPDLTRAGDITLDDLGSHLSGYPDFYPLDFVDRRMMKPTTPETIVREYATVPLEFEPRTLYSYSNTGFIVLGRVIEKVSGQPLGEFLRRRVFEPAGMTRASLTPPPTTPGLAAGHRSFALGPPEQVPAEAEGWLHAAGGIYATATDLARWNLALAGGKVLNPKSLARLATARNLASGRSTDYGCGIGVRRMGGETVLTHTGAVSGFLAYNAFIPRTRTGVILLVNTEGGSPGEIYQQLLALLIGPTTHVPTVRGAPPAEVARELFRQMQNGTIDRSRLAPELSHYLDDARLRAAAPRLRALGEPTAVEAADFRGRGGLEVSNIRFTFPDRVVKALMYRRPDGTIEEFLLLHD
jgi:D-alanyl-D-alanine carboxypeptidase